MERIYGISAQEVFDAAKAEIWRLATDLWVPALLLVGIIAAFIALGCRYGPKDRKTGP